MDRWCFRRSLLQLGHCRIHMEPTPHSLKEMKSVKGVASHPSVLRPDVRLKSFRNPPCYKVLNLVDIKLKFFHFRRMNRL